MKKVTLGLFLLFISFIGYSQANQKLSNLVNPTAVNINLLPGGTGTKNFGNASHKWKDGFFAGTVNSNAFVASGTASIGVSSYGSNYGVYGYGPYIGVYGSGTSYGVYGYSSAAYGIAGASNTGYGLYGTSSTTYNASGSTGVYGSAYYGVHGKGTYGVWGESASSGYGIYGSSNYIGSYGTGTNYGVYGYSSLNTGVYGYSNGSSSSTYSRTGVYGYCASYGYGVVGYSVNGSGVYATGGTYGGYFNGSVYTTGTYTGSDAKLKQNITEFSSGMDILNKLQPKIYEFRQDGNFKLMHLPEGKHYGLIAQELEQVLPSLVKDTKFETRMEQPMKPEDPTTGSKAEQQNGDVIEFKAVNYTELIPVIIKAVQELDLQNKALKTEVEQLKNALRGGTAITGFEKATLTQNQPNPFSGKTLISFNVPEVFKIASLVVTQTGSGKVVKNISLTKGTSQISFDGSSLANGNYTYTLVVDGKTVDSKQMLIAR